MLDDHASQWIYNSRITTVFYEFSRFTLCLPVNSRSRDTPFRPWHVQKQGQVLWWNARYAGYAVRMWWKVQPSFGQSFPQVCESNIPSRARELS